MVNDSLGEFMEQQALALKYRPINFDELVGQEAVSRTLSLALDSKRLSHAYLFSGLRGSGKTSSARIFARALECENGPTSKPCGVCANCVAANPHKMRHIDIIEIDGASNRKIDDIRDLIEQTKYHPSMGRFKIFIIDEVHMLTKEAFNALLKTLEEPPEYVKFILATTDPLKLPATILSRTQHFRFKTISDKNIFIHLKKILELEKIPYQEEALKMLIRSGSGSLRDTLTLLDQVMIYSNYNITAESCVQMLGLINPQSLSALFDAIFSQDSKEVLAHLEGFFEYDCEMLLESMGVFLRDKLFSGDDTRYNALIVDRLFRVIIQAREMLFLGGDNTFVLTLSVFKMLEALKVESIDKAIADLEKGFFEALPTALQRNQKDIKPVLKEVATNLGDSYKDETSPSLAQESTSNLREEGLEKFKLLQERIYALNYDLGEIFTQDVRFVSYVNNVLTWESLANGANKERLRKSYAQIKTLVLEVFGLHTHIEFISNPRPLEQDLEQQSKNESIPLPSQESISDQSSNKDFNANKTEREVEVESALNSPLLKQARELLEIKQVKVHYAKENE